MAYWLKYGNYSLTKNGAAVGEADHPVDPYNPLGLPPYTIRAKFSSGYTPTMGDSRTLVDAGENVWDITKASTNWTGLFSSIPELLEILGANSTNVTDLTLFCSRCGYLESVGIFDTSNVTSFRMTFYYCERLRLVPEFPTQSVINMSSAFHDCYALRQIPALSTVNVTDMADAFYFCTSVESGALALYTQASSQTTPPASHIDCFKFCGRDTVTGAQELAQIPTSWGGTMA